MFKDNFLGFEGILRDDRILKQNNNVRFEYARFSDFKSMNECLKKEFIQFGGKSLSLERGYI
jgi:hypothetical protein